MVGRTPSSARVPLDPLLASEINASARSKPTGASAADGGVRPTIHADVPRWENLAALRTSACATAYPTMTTVTCPGPCTPRTRICSISAVRLGPVISTMELVCVRRDAAES